MNERMILPYTLTFVISLYCYKNLHMEWSLRLIKLCSTLLHLSHLHSSVLLGTICGVWMVVKAKYMDFVGKEALN